MSRIMTLPRIGTAEAWRDAARAHMVAGTPPDQIAWGDTTTERGLFDEQAALPPAGKITVPRAFIDMADRVVWHSDPARFARLYAFLWRLRDAPHLMSDRGDADLARLRAMEKSVRRCQHKMKAFVRFREIGDPAAPRRSFAAWFEPTHHTVEPTAQFFVRRFADMDWRIITPDISAVFDDGTLRFLEDQPNPQLPDDASEALWITYFQNIFNPARLKVQAMQSEMPKKYWKNLPEAAAIPDLIAGAPARARTMAASAPTLAPRRAASAQSQFKRFVSTWDGSDDAFVAALRGCTRCPLHRDATQAVPGAGPRDAALMIVGEQPGDQEDLAGQPFVGPAGRLFDEMAMSVGLDRSRAYITNAVKHFKFTPRGKRRLHQRPNSDEISHCRWWLDAEVTCVAPKLILAMGAVAAEALTGNGKDLLTRRGKVVETTGGTPVLITVHPSYLLRIPDADKKAEGLAWFKQDLEAALRFAEGAERESKRCIEGAERRA
ncbi:UdgX family uracil-DNA binding protein [Rhodobacteraceae bacterium N5(2021)]|uniref:Type-4 uracil-DNA glycosylase n=2 Tax=Gymnodinialimonas phycosphaerae TaxID=2841589 RepID=A0A975YHK1_9RHOB|nr:UdgX family uracil-DNA binding protein [Gymnodinialimonas phycosphaerae]MBY4892863.1 UdgX family uracil-DNA binding protein [Gymnodinialimonas phycosphaerae]